MTDLDELDVAFKEIDLDQSLLASHPAYNYLARRYGWKITNLNLDPDSISGTGSIPVDHPAKVILWESAPLEGWVKLLDESHGLESIVFSPAELEGEQDYLATMRTNVERLAAALK